MQLSTEKINAMLHELSVNNSQEALKSLYLYYYSKLNTFLSYYVRDHQVIQEIISDSFLAIWEQKNRLSGIYNFNAYIYGVARNRAVSHLRKELAKSKDVEIETVSPYLQGSSDPESVLITEELTVLLNKTIETLPAKSKLVFKLIREENLKYKDAAEVLDVSVKTIEAHMTLAVKRLREALSKEINND